MKAFFALRGDSSSRRKHRDDDDDTTQGTGYDSREDIFYPTSTSASTAPPPTATTTKSKRKFFKTNTDRSHSSKTSTSTGWIDVARNGAGAAPLLHGPASSSSASGPNAADIGSMPVAASVRSKKSNGSFGSHGGGGSAGNAGGIGALLGGFNSVNSLGRSDDVPGRNRTSIRSGSLASIFTGSGRPGSMTKMGSFAGSDTTRGSHTNGHHLTDPRPPSASSTGGLHPYPTGQLTRKGSVASQSSSHASMKSDDNNGVRKSLVRGLFKDRSAGAGSPVATTTSPTSHAPSSYYDPTSTRTKRRGITPPTLEGRTSGGWPGLKEAPDVHPEVFIVSNDSTASGKRRGSGPETAANPNGTASTSDASPQPPADTAQEEVTPRADQGQAQFQPHLAEDLSNGTRRHSAISTATIQPSHRDFAVEASEPAPAATIPIIQPPIATQETDASAPPKASLRKRLSGTLRPRKSLNFFSNNGDQVDPKSKRRSQAFSEGGASTVSSPHNTRFNGSNENSPLSPSLVRRPSANSGASISISRHRPTTSSTSVSRASSIVSVGTANMSTQDRSTRRRDSSIASSPPSAAYNRFKGGSSKRGHHAAANSLSSPHDLALQLNELAVSHADGLLSDEEYRMLRQGLFEEQLGQRAASSTVAESGMVAPATATAPLADSPTSYFAILAGRESGGGGGLTSPGFRQSVVDADEGVRGDVTASEDSQRMQDDQRSTAGASTVSRSHLPSLFRRGSHRSQQSQASDGYDGRLPSLPPTSKSRSNTISTADTTASSSSSSGGVGGRSLHPVRLPHNGSRSTKSGSSSINSSSQQTTSRPEPSIMSYHGGGGASASSVRLRLTSSSSAKSQRRAQDLETAVRRRRAQRANSLLSAESGHSGRGDDGSSILTRGRATSLVAEDDSVLQLQQATAAVSFTANASRLDTQDVVYADKSSEEIEAELRVIETEGRKLLFAFESLESALFKRIGEDNTTLVDQIEHGLPAKMDLTTAGSFNTRNKKIRNKSTPVDVTLAPVNFPTASLQKVQAQLIDVRTRRADVVERYEDRMAFLRSKARGARIREQLA